MPDGSDAQVDPHLDEQFPLSPLDDYMIHQTPDPIRVMWTSDPRAYERYWMVCHDAAGEVLLATGGSFYPNLDRAEAYAIVVHAGLHTSVRAFRRLGVDRTDMRVGPIAPEVIRGLRHIRFLLEENDFGVAFEIDFEDMTRQVFREPLSRLSSGAPPGRRNDVTTGFEGFGRVRGWISVGGKRFALGDGSFGTRDRHWGTGRGVGGPALALGDRLHVGTNGNAFVAFSDWALWGDKAFYYFGDPRPGAGRVGKPNRRLRFEPDTNLFAEGVIEYPLGTGEVKVVRYAKLGQQTAFLRCGMYGGTPDRDIHQGGYDGPDLVEGETYEIDQPAVRARIAGLDEHLCEVRCGEEHSIGIYQTIDPLAHQHCAAGRSGWAFL
ncbi:MAG TPA: hypothetical protein VGF95_08370 [Solirubrobacteraceae bacterium]